MLENKQKLYCVVVLLDLLGTSHQCKDAFIFWFLCIRFNNGPMWLTAVFVYGFILDLHKINYLSNMGCAKIVLKCILGRITE